MLVSIVCCTKGPNSRDEREEERPVSVGVLNHPPYIPDLSPRNLHTFGHLKKEIFKTDSEVQKSILALLHNLDSDFYVAGFDLISTKLVSIRFLRCWFRFDFYDAGFDLISTMLVSI
ncbi:hypothetical protein TNCV_2837891 [Trichonephila clavipes]|nr:hypothetical protein TNCV_2837891 [Trichonephila clavipes]